MHNKNLTQRERDRLTVQTAIDAERSAADRNRLGQFATPPALARDILEYAKTLHARGKVRFLDPGIGSGSFYAALRATFPASRIASAAGFEIDPAFADAATSLWGDTGLTVRRGDFTDAPPSNPAATLLISNPPYVRHHHLDTDTKQRLQARVARELGLRLDGLSGLYCYFLCLSHAHMADGGLAGWLIPSEFMDVNYGRGVREYLLKHVTLLRIHRFDPADVQFGDALVSSAVVWFRKAPPPSNHAVEFTYGGSLATPKHRGTVSVDTLRLSNKWTQFPRHPRAAALSAPARVRIGDLFTIRRGIATGANGFFVVSGDDARQWELPDEFLTPLLPSPRHLDVDEIPSDDRGIPTLPRSAFLVDCTLPEKVVAQQHPALWRYFEEGRRSGIADRYLCRHRGPWYAQEQRPAAPIVCTYMGRGAAGKEHPFRFILNRSRATATNVYLLLYPKRDVAHLFNETPSLLELVWRRLNEIPPAQLLGEGRVYGGGLYKMEPKELANVSADFLFDGVLPQAPTQRHLFEPEPSLPHAAAR